MVSPIWRTFFCSGSAGSRLHPPFLHLGQPVPTIPMLPGSVLPVLQLFPLSQGSFIVALCLLGSGVPSEASCVSPWRGAGCRGAARCLHPAGSAGDAAAPGSALRPPRGPARVGVLVRLGRNRAAWGTAARALGFSLTSEHGAWERNPCALRMTTGT